MNTRSIVDLREEVPVEVRELVEGLIKDGFEVRVRVTGRSMHPYLRGGEVVTIRPARVEPFGFGDLILTRGPAGTLVLHRVIGRTAEGSWLTKGDGLRAPDAPVRPADVLGVVVLIQDGAERVRRLDTRAGKREGRRAATRSVAIWRVRRLGAMLKQAVLGRRG